MLWSIGIPYIGPESSGMSSNADWVDIFKTHPEVELCLYFDGDYRTLTNRSLTLA